ncbi:MAG: phosphotransferase, partial [Gammaproteobacteria bacterium]|nr:phosphotransferase [Gammaproteobacteria bacterium]
MNTINPNNHKPIQDRESQLQNWLASITAYEFSAILPASGDASFRLYFRTADKNSGQSYVVMDAPPEKEDCEPFIRIAKMLRSAGVTAPEIIEQNLAQGFLLLTDLGDQPYLNHLNERHAETLYSDAVSALIHMQNIKPELMSELPVYDEPRLREEMELFEQWYLNRHLNVTLDDSQKEMLANTFDLLIKSALEQPQTFVHRDYHSRNLMLLEKNNPGVIDFQDAVIGPCTYDLVSLFKDCYIEWPREKIEQWLEDYLF